MRRWRAVLGRLDPWAALLLGVFVTLAVVILLATPGPWQDVVGVSRPVSIASLPPSDAAVFVVGSSDGTCTGVLWLHADHRRRSLTVTVIPPLTQAPVEGGGLVPIDRIVDDLGAPAATAALERVLDVDLALGVLLDRRALRLTLHPIYAAGDSRAQRRLTQQGRRAWNGTQDPSAAWLAQYRTLAAAMPRVALAEMNVVAFANYVLGFGPVESGLDLQSVTTLAKMIKELDPRSLNVRANSAVVAKCRSGEAWSLHETGLNQMRHSLAVGLTPPDAEPTTQVQRREARVLVVVPDTALVVSAYEAEVRRALALSAGAPVDVRVVAVKPGRLYEAVRATVREWRPLAVLVAPAGVGDGADEAQVEAFGNVTAFLARRGEPAVLSLPAEFGSPAAQSSASISGRLATLAESSGLPVSRWVGATGGPSAEAAREAARAHVETLVHTCWQGTLAPDLASTRRGFSFAAAREVAVEVRAQSARAAQEVAARLQLWGYDAASGETGRWRPTRQGEAVYYRPGRLRAALALGGDYGLERSRIVAAKSAPVELILVLDE